MQTLILIFLGSGIGGVTRFGVYQLISYFQQNSWVGTIICNLVGSFIIALLTSYFISLNNDSKNAHYLLIVGFLGGFTTFSAFSLDSIKFLQDNNLSTMSAYIAINVIGSLLMCVAGFAVARIVLGR